MSLLYYKNTRLNVRKKSKEIFKIAKVDCKVNPITTQQYPTPAKRPINTIMSVDKIVGIFSLNTPNWKESLIKFRKHEYEK